MLSSTLSTYSALLCVDDNPLTFCHSALRTSEPWLSIELPQRSLVAYVQIFNRVGFEYRLGRFELWIGERSGAHSVSSAAVKCAEEEADASTKVLLVRCGSVGQFVTLLLPGTQRTLNIGDVVLFMGHSPRSPPSLPPRPPLQPPPPNLPLPPCPPPSAPLPPETPLSQAAMSGGAIGLSPFPPPATGDGTGGGVAPVFWQAFGSSPIDAANRLVANLTVAEQAALLQGVGWQGYSIRPQYFVGNIRGVPRFGIPSQNAQDAGQGFRTSLATQVGQVTSFPCALSAAATWDPTLVYRYAAAIGREFRTKGANVILGPSVNVHRVAKGGRNAEYISGEDGALGGPLAAAYVRGVQSEGVAAVVKHWVLNSQETKREWGSSDASERTLMEVYVPPFQAAVNAGVASFMCGYNRVNGSHVCGNQRLTDILRNRLGFQGFMMTDWWALHGVDAAKGGVDQEQPGSQRNGQMGFFGRSSLQSSGADISGMARRVLTGMMMSGAFDSGSSERQRCTAGSDCNFQLYQAIATTAQHVTIAREVAAASTVLLKNDGGVLPIRRGASVALLGSACSASFLSSREGAWDAGDYYTIGVQEPSRARSPLSSHILIPFLMIAFHRARRAFESQSGRAPDASSQHTKSLTASNVAWSLG